MVAEVTRPMYTIRAARSEGWWILTAPQVPGVVSQVRSLAHAEEYAREAISFVLDVPENSFDVTIDPVLPADLSRRVRRARKSVAEAERLRREAAALSSDAVRELLSTGGLKGREAAIVLGVSPQRVSQLAHRTDG